MAPLETIRLCIAIPTAGMVRMGFAYSLVGMVSKLAAHGCPTRPEASIEVKLDVVESSVIHSNREQLVRRAIDSGYTHLLFLDDDMVFEPQVLDILLGRRQMVVAVNYAMKKDPIEFVGVGLHGGRITTNEDSTGLIPISYTGFGVALFDLEVFKKTPQPWFAPEFIPDQSMYTTEDNPCFRRIREAGFICYLDQDASKLVSHVGGKAYRWDQWVKPVKKAPESPVSPTAS